MERAPKALQFCLTFGVRSNPLNTILYSNSINAKNNTFLKYNYSKKLSSDK